MAINDKFKQGGTPIGRQHSGQCFLLLQCMNPSPQSGSCLPKILGCLSMVMIMIEILLLIKAKY